jgi:hypothetical protein
MCCAPFIVVLMGSPLATLGTVLKTQKTDSMPLMTTLVTAGNALSWTLYGSLVAQDPMIYVPRFVSFRSASILHYIDNHHLIIHSDDDTNQHTTSAIGLIPASLQLLLYFIYGLPHSKKESLLNKDTF